MRAINILLALVSLNTAAASISKVPGCPSDEKIIAHDGTSVGREVKDGATTLYVAEPKKKSKQYETAVLYLTDVFGIQLAQNRLLVDSFARAGYLTIAPDMFNGKPAPADLNTPGFNSTAFLAAHGPNATDPIIASSIKYIREKFGVKKIGATGYCYGGRYAFRFIAPGKGVQVAFTAHPSLLENSEITAIDGPVSVAAAETDDLLPPAKRFEMETLLSQINSTFQVALYSGTNHGFGVRANISDPQQKFGKEAAFFQAVRWFDAWLK